MDTNLLTEDERERYEERAAIREHLGGLSREESERLAREDVAKEQFECEVRDVVKKYRDHGGEFVRKYLLLVEKARGSAAANRLREAALSRVRLAKVGKGQT